jgi:CheY-like chemotaxis protein
MMREALGMRVLIVEDVAGEAELFAEMVRSQGHVPAVALTAEDAVEHLASAPPDAVLLDLHLPGMRGLDLMRALSERHPSIPVIAMSGVATEDEAQQSLALGAVEFLTRPVGPDRLRLVLDFLALGALARGLGDRVAPVNRRRYPRIALSVDVRVEQEAALWQPGWTTDLSPFGIRFRVPVRTLRPGHLVRLAFEPPDGQPGMSVLSLVVRLDAEDAAASFIDLTAGDFRRLRALVDDRAGSA